MRSKRRTIFHHRAGPPRSETIPASARIDALHVACATYHDIDVLRTWNCTHIANPERLPVMRGLCAARGYTLPELVTPFELMEVSP